MKKLYMLQIHDTNGTQFDTSWLFDSVEKLCKEFNTQFKRYESMGATKMEREDITMNADSGELYGMFSFENADGSETWGRVFDAHVA